MSFLVPFVYLFFMTGNFTLLFQKRFEEMLPSAIMISGLFLYLMTYIKILFLGDILV